MSAEPHRAIGAQAAGPILGRHAALALGLDLAETQRARTRAREHVVVRRLGLADIQTILSLYGWVSEDAELRALAGWRSFCSGWRGWDGRRR